MTHSLAQQFGHKASEHDFYAANQNLHFFGVFATPERFVNQQEEYERQTMTKMDCMTLHEVSLNDSVATEKVLLWHSNAFCVTRHADDFAAYSRAYEAMNNEMSSARHKDVA